MPRIDFASYGVAPKKFSPAVTMRVEDDDFGYFLNILSIDQKVELDPPLGTEAERSSREMSYIKLDIDYYTLKDTPVASFNAELWMEKVAHTIRRDTDKIFSKLASK